MLGKFDPLTGMMTRPGKIGTALEKTVTPFSNSAKVDVPGRFIGKRVYVIMLKN